MPFNLLLLPLLAGYLFLSKSRLRSYATSQLAKDQLLLLAAVYGLLFLIASRVVCLALLQTDVGVTVALSLHEFAPFKFIGTAAGTLILAGLLIVSSNVLVSEKVAGFWLYHQGALDPLTRMLWASGVGAAPQKTVGAFRLTIRLGARMVRYVWQALGFRRLMGTPLREFPGLFQALKDAGVELSGLPQGQACTVMINLKDGKVITGWVLDLPTDRPKVEFVTIAPLWTGYRDDKNRVLKSVDYAAAIDRIATPGSKDDPRSFARVIRTADITAVSLFDDTAFMISWAAESSE